MVDSSSGNEAVASLSEARSGVQRVVVLALLLAVVGIGLGVYHTNVVGIRTMQLRGGGGGAGGRAPGGGGAGGAGGAGRQRLLLRGGYEGALLGQWR